MNPEIETKSNYFCEVQIASSEEWVCAEKKACLGCDCTIAMKAPEQTVLHNECIRSV